MKMDFLREIIEHTRVKVDNLRRVQSTLDLRARAEQQRHGVKPHAFRAAFADDSRLNIVAEFKRASPSKGLIRAGADAAEVARDYEANGAIAISVLTEESRFMGSLDDLREVRAAVELPTLRKDFIIDEYQVYEAAVGGADAVLLIAAALDDEALGALRNVAEDELGLDALVEVHTRDELHRAFSCGAGLIGVNNRDLRTFAVSIETSVELAKDLPTDVIAISESGLATGADLRRLRANGYAGFLIGESLMRKESPGETLRQLIDAGKD